MTLHKYETYYFLEMYGQLSVTLLATFILSMPIWFATCCLDICICTYLNCERLVQICGTSSADSIWVRGVVTLAQFLYGEKSVELKHKKVYSKNHCIKIYSSYFKLAFASIAPVLYQNLMTIGSLLGLFLGFLLDVHATYECTTEMDCFKLNRTIVHYNYGRIIEVDAMPITNCSLVNDTDEIACYKLTFTTAISEQRQVHNITNHGMVPQKLFHNNYLENASLWLVFL